MTARACCALLPPLGDLLKTRNRSGTRSRNCSVSVLRFVTCVIALWLVLAVPCCRRQGDANVRDPGLAPAGPRPNIIMLTVDTLRADHMALYGYARDTMPAIEAFAKTAVVFDNAVVPRGATRPSYASMLTGLYPFHHGVRSNRTAMHADLTTLPEALKSAGYHTAGFVSNFVLIGKVGLNQGFDIYDDRLEEREAVRAQFERTADNTLTAIREWLDSRPPQPFFLFTNFIDPHGPYTPPDRFRNLYPTTKVRLLSRDQIPPYQLVDRQLNYFDYVDRYDGEISYTDEALGSLIGELKRRELWDDALVVFTADHGEYFGEHNAYFEHHYHVWEETMHVPLVIRLPGVSTVQSNGPTRIRSVCSPMDLMPTILSYLKLPYDVRLDGQDLLPLMAGKPDNGRAILMEFPAAVQISSKTRKADVYAVRTTTHKLIRLLQPNTGTLLRQAVYDLVADPQEQNGLRLDTQDALQKDLGRQSDLMLAQVRSYELPFALTVYEMPSDWGRIYPQPMSRARKTIHKRLTTDQAQRLRSLGYAQ